MAPKIRVDARVVALGLAESQEAAARLIRAGLVFAPDRRLDKPGHLVTADLEITIKGVEHPYVSRGGVKLAGALDAFAIDPKGRIALDLGSSTGGFTDCLLQRGAARVYAIDVGRSQLHSRLLADGRVVSREQTHLDDLRPDMFAPPPTLVVADLSFISATRAFEPIRRVAPGSESVILVKPQFELDRELVPKGGVVRDDALHREAVRYVADRAREGGFAVLGEVPSSIEGGDGNREFFLHLRLPSP